MVLATPAWGDLRFQTEITYTADISDGNLLMESSIRLTNLTPDETDGLQIIRYFYDHIQIRVPETVQGFRATSGSSDLGFSLQPTGRPEDEGFLIATIGLGQRLFFEESMDLVVSYQIPGDPPRSETTFRINPAYISFGVAGWGDPEGVTVNVIAPATFDLRLEGSDWDTTRVEGDNRVFTATDIAEPADFFIQVRGYDDGALASETVTAAGLDVMVRSWPDDEEWGTLVSETVSQGLPELQRLIGLDPPEVDLEIRESADVTLAGYGGWYLVAEDLIEIGEWASPHLVLHELSHMWFNQSLFLERWIHEGLADEYATRAAHNVGLGSEQSVRPRAAPMVSRLVGPLNDWVIPTGLERELERDELEDYEGYGYRASFWVVQELVDEIGVEAMSAVLEAAANRHIAYQGAPEPEQVGPHNDWRRFLDLVEELGRSQRAEQLFTTYVTDEDLTQRAEARAAYQQLTTAAGWQSPFYVREPMSEWDFPTAMARIEETATVAEMRDRIEANNTTLGVETSETLREAYEHATGSVSEVIALANHQLEASTAVLTAHEALGSQRNLVMDIGLAGADPESRYQQAVVALSSEDLDQAYALAVEVVDLLSRAERMGTQRLLVGAPLLLLILLAGYLAVRRRRQALDEPTDS